MATMNKKGIRNRKHLRSIIRTPNVKISKINVIPHGGRLLRKFKNKRGEESMENTVKCNNDYIPDFIEGVDIDDGISLLESFKSMRKGFLRARIGKGEISEDDPVVKKFLEE